ncbi:MAG: hypothetical protein ABIH46_07435 [Chloroflexota bacterium]
MADFLKDVMADAIRRAHRYSNPGSNSPLGFSPEEFLGELAVAYDSLVAEEIELQKPRRIPRDIGQKLKNVRLRIQQYRGRPYPEEVFVSDLERLLASGKLYIPDGRRFWLSPSREVTTNITIRVPPVGHEVQYGVIAFRAPE